MTSSSSPHPDGKRDPLLGILNRALEEELALSETMHDYLRRISGPNSHSLFRLFGDHARQLDRWLGELSARLRGAGSLARIGARELAHSATASIAPQPNVAPRNMVGELLGVHEGIAARLREELAGCPTDSPNADLLGRLVDFHDTAAWILRMVLQREDVPDPQH